MKISAAVWRNWYEIKYRKRKRGVAWRRRVGLSRSVGSWAHRSRMPARRTIAARCTALQHRAHAARALLPSFDTRDRAHLHARAACLLCLAVPSSLSSAHAPPALPLLPRYCHHCAAFCIRTCSQTAAVSGRSVTEWESAGAMNVAT